MRKFISRLKLRALLQLAPFLIGRASPGQPRLRQLLDERNFVMQIVTTCGSGGHFVLHNGNLTFQPGKHAQPDFVQTWTSARAAAAALTNRDETELLRAFEDGRCRMRGDFSVALWFNEAMKLART